MVEMNDNYKTKEFENAKEFWDFIDPRNDIFRKQSNPIFRGQRCEEWGLIPSIFRGNTPIEKLWGFKNVASDGFIFAEQSVVRTFLEQCDIQGLKVEGDSKAFRKKYISPGSEMKNNSDFKKWPFEEVKQILATMQHYGIPTRLLDWSKRSFVAAYFAASEVLEKKDFDGNMAVWTLNTEIKGLYSEHYELVEFPGSVNNYLSSQSGIFTLQKIPTSRGHSYEKEEMFFEKGFKTERGDLIKITVPKRFAKEIMKLCWDFGVSASVLFPGVEGVRKGFNDHISVYEKGKN